MEGACRFHVGLLPPALFSSAPLDLSPSAGVYERRGVGLLVLDAKDSTALHLSAGTRKAHAMIRDAVDGAETARLRRVALEARAAITPAPDGK